MKYIAVMLATATLFAAPCHAREDDLLIVLQTVNELYVDSVALRFATIETIPTPDFGGSEVEDTFDIGIIPMFPSQATVWYTLEGRPVEPLFLEEVPPDRWLELEGDGLIKFVTVQVGCAEDRLTVLPRSGVTASPNPFSATTRLRWEQAAPAAVRADVFDRSGRLVRTLLDARLGAGSHSLCWDGCDDQGNRLEPGVYLLRLRSGQDSRLLKVVLTP